VDAHPDVGIVVATRNRRARLLATLERLAALPERPPVCLVDNGSTDGTPDAVEASHPDVTVIRLDHNAGAAARNAGVTALETPLVAFNDDDSWWAPGALTRAARTFQAYPRLGLLAACVLVGEQARVDPVSSEMAASPIPALTPLPGPPVLGFLACGAVVRRSAFLQAGGFNPRYGVGGEEELLAMDVAAAGWGLAFVPSVETHHHPARGPRRGRRRIQVRNELWSTWLRRPLRPALGHTLRVVSAAGRSREGRAGLAAALRGLPWVMRQRSVLPPEVEHVVALLHGR
jgi:GT2 family glycosyltransferase